MSNKPTATKKPTPAKKAAKKQSKNARSSPNIEVSIKDVLISLLKMYGIKEGHWILETNTGSGRIMATQPDGKDAFPATLVVLESFTLVRVKPEDRIIESSNTIDASQL
ncbi:hypothetical protein [Orrella sp. 11846]|uniref:hypothetical protein n=1 Tax=Orrella sp. 11846 TaxID=3409913 RepID=UPI003B58F37F